MDNKKIAPHNPLIVPTDEELKESQSGEGGRSCPKCRNKDFGGRKVGGVITFTCRVCRNEWSGGLPIEPIDPHRPLPPSDPMHLPSVVFTKKDGVIKETRRAVSLTQEFRKGAPVPAPGEEDV